MSERALMMEGDVLEALRLMPDASCDAALFDPPYGIGSKRPTAAMLAAYLRGDDLRTGDFMGPIRPQLAATRLHPSCPASMARSTMRSRAP